MLPAFSRIYQITSNPGRPPGRYPFSKSTWLRYVQEGKAPAAVKFGPNITAWSNADLDAWDKQITNGLQVQAIMPTAKSCGNKSTDPTRRKPGRPRTRPIKAAA